MNIILRLITSIIIIMLSMTGTATANQSWNFKVLLDDEIIGEHKFQLTNKNNQSFVKIDANFDVYFFFIKAYSYKHTNYEIWNGNCLQSIKSNTDDNGELHNVNGKTRENSFYVKTATEQYNANGCVRTFSYWDPTFLKSQSLLNSQTGEIMPVQIELLGEENIEVRNKTVLADHYQIRTNDFMIDLWYSKNNEWLSLNSTTSSGAVLRYQIQ